MVASENSLCRLLDPNYFLLPLLGSLFTLEIAVGLNGRVWINSSQDAKCIIAIKQAIEAADPDGQGMDELGINTLLEDLGRRLGLSFSNA